MNKLEQLKFAQRTESTKRRKKIFNKNIDVNKKLFSNLKFSKLFNKSNIIASYYSINSEIQTKDLNENIIKSGKTVCLPVIEKKNSPLIFRVLNHKTKMIKGEMNLMEPNEDSITVIPDLILVPCLAFDKTGNRLGYGGGYYDMTINDLKKKFYNLSLVIVAFSDQEVKSVNVNENDQKLDYILTEKKLQKI